MIYEGNSARDIKIAYIGGGSRGWAWGLMSDLAKAGDINGSVYLYDIDFEAARRNEIIGNKAGSAEGAVSDWKYKAVKTIGEALDGADFVIISILPGTFDEMESEAVALWCGLLHSLVRGFVYDIPAGIGDGERNRRRRREAVMKLMTSGIGSQRKVWR